MKNIEYQNIIEACILQIINEFHLNPFVYVMESDIQAHLYVKIFKELKKKDESFIKLANINKSYSKIWPDKGRKTTVLHCELPIPKRNHIDIGLWDETELTTDEWSYWKKIKYAIEIKYNWECSLTKALKAGLINDLKKMIDNNVEYGHLLCFLGREIDNIKKEMSDWENLLAFVKKEYEKTSYNIQIYTINPRKAYRYLLQGKKWQELNNNQWVNF